MIWRLDWKSVGFNDHGFHRSKAQRHNLSLTRAARPEGPIQRSPALRARTTTIALVVTAAALIAAGVMLYAQMPSGTASPQTTTTGLKETVETIKVARRLPIGFPTSPAAPTAAPLRTDGPSSGTRPTGRRWPSFGTCRPAPCATWISTAVTWRRSPTAKSTATDEDETARRPRLRPSSASTWRPTTSSTRSAIAA